MPIFIVETAATSPIREYWKVEAATAEEAAETYGDKGECLYDEVLGEEEGRQVSEVHPYSALAGFFAAEAARKEAPAMLAALQEFLCDQETMREPYRNEAICERARAILARIDGAAPAPTAPAPVAAPGFAAHALDTLKDCEAWFANGGDVDGVFFDDATMLDRVRESLALATPTAQPAGDTCQACGRGSLDCSRAPCPTVVAERGEG